ncbi:lysoplasmalogenase [Amycolatopsis taiwanensis]|uniref:lysoplasmalogenase n=1 Tax=Amycolatopsis taiwanensis TaxID=342230 RepID=UPI0004B9DFAD|nr:lysoplasmalogenase [Amycolatopsis taiwanensis]
MTIKTLPPVARCVAAAYALLCLAHIALSDGGVQVAGWITKPMLMPVLAVFTWLVGRAAVERPALRLPLAGILFGGAGDTALMGEGIWFIVGMGCFAIGHLCYLAAMRQRGAHRGVRRATVAGYAVVWVVLLVLTWSGLGDLLVPVIAYSLLLVTMAVVASGLPRPGAIGGALFVISDGFIALSLANVQLFPHQSWIVMPTYVVAQFLLAVALLGGLPSREATRSTSAPSTTAP